MAYYVPISYVRAIPYSLDLNPIEKFCANMKMWIRNQITPFGKFYEPIIAFFYVQTSL
ncbi:hypothetical protein [Orientia tsutsugamushi]|uniref:hypothetical protein n=1 Tax=Orientia tsutsugamushi TaxID=784 RepID=UPI001E321F75|nr:hypothetical protein [Orientia tsutsugamushi]